MNHQQHLDKIARARMALKAVRNTGSQQAAAEQLGRSQSEISRDLKWARENGVLDTPSAKSNTVQTPVQKSAPANTPSDMALRVAECHVRHRGNVVGIMKELGLTRSSAYRYHAEAKRRGLIATEPIGPSHADRVHETVEAYKATGSYLAAARMLGCDRTTVRDRIYRAEKAGLIKSGECADARRVYASRVVGNDLSPTDALKYDRQITAATNDNKQLRKKLEASEKELVELSARYDTLTEIDKMPKRRLTIPTYRSGGDGNGCGIFVGVASDWHVEEDVDPKTIAGYNNEYNPQIAEARAKKFFQSYAFMLDSWRTVGTCDTAVLALLGDFISGYIHPELMAANHLSPTKASVFAQELLGSGIEYILSNCNLTKLIIPCCYGNHGRTTLKPMVQTGADNSFEWYMYHQMAKLWGNEKRVEFHVANGYHVETDLFDFRIRWHHGDAVQFGGGVGGLTIPLRKKIAQWNKGAPKAAHLDVLGHFHQMMDGGDFMVNGSLIGFNAFAVKIGAAYERPRQSCLWIDSKRGKTMSGELFVEADAAAEELTVRSAKRAIRRAA